jgi:hypothetical protein
VTWVVAGSASGLAQYAGWFIPEGGAEEKSPLAATRGAADNGDLRTSLNPEGVLGATYD